MWQVSICMWQVSICLWQVNNGRKRKWTFFGKSATRKGSFGEVEWVKVIWKARGEWANRINLVNLRVWRENNRARLWRDKVCVATTNWDARGSYPKCDGNRFDGVRWCINCAPISQCCPHPWWEILLNVHTRRVSSLCYWDISEDFSSMYIWVAKWTHRHHHNIHRAQTSPPPKTSTTSQLHLTTTTTSIVSGEIAAAITFQPRRENVQ